MTTTELASLRDQILADRGEDAAIRSYRASRTLYDAIVEARARSDAAARLARVLAMLPPVRDHRVTAVR